MTGLARQARLVLLQAALCTCCACSLVGLSDEVALEGCETDLDCAALEADAGADGGNGETCPPFVCGNLGVCERTKTVNGTVRIDCEDGTAADAGVTSQP